jgi:hypothetical protein
VITAGHEARKTDIRKCIAYRILVEKSEGKRTLATPDVDGKS